MVGVGGLGKSGATLARDFPGGVVRVVVGSFCFALAGLGWLLCTGESLLAAQGSERDYPALYFLFTYA